MVTGPTRRVLAMVASIQVRSPKPRAPARICTTASKLVDLAEAHRPPATGGDVAGRTCAAVDGQELAKAGRTICAALPSTRSTPSNRVIHSISTTAGRCWSTEPSPCSTPGSTDDTEIWAAIAARARVVRTTTTASTSPDHAAPR